MTIGCNEIDHSSSLCLSEGRQMSAEYRRDWIESARLTVDGSFMATRTTTTY